MKVLKNGKEVKAEVTYMNGKPWLVREEGQLGSRDASEYELVDDAKSVKKTAVEKKVKKDSGKQ